MFETTAARFYAKQTYKQLNKVYRPTWLPIEPIGLGDIGILQHGVFRRIASFKGHFGVDLPIRDDLSPSPLDVTYSKATKIVFKAAGETKADLPNVPTAKAGFGVEFSRTGAFTVRAAECFEPSVENIIALQAQVVQLFAEGKWDKNWVVVVKRVHCRAATIIISKSNSTKMEFSVSGDVPSGGIVLGSASASFQLEAATNAAFNFVEALDVTPFVQLMSLGDQIFEGIAAGTKLTVEATEVALPPLVGVTPHMAASNEKVRQRLSLVPAVDLDDDVAIDEE